MKKKLLAILSLLILFAAAVLGSACQTVQISTESDKTSAAPTEKETEKATEAPTESSTEAEKTTPTIPDHSPRSLLSGSIKISLGNKVRETPSYTFRHIEKSGSIRCTLSSKQEDVQNATMF